MTRTPHDPTATDVDTPMVDTATRAKALLLLRQRQRERPGVHDGANLLPPCEIATDAVIT